MVEIRCGNTQYTECMLIHTWVWLTEWWWGDVTTCLLMATLTVEGITDTGIPCIQHCVLQCKIPMREGGEERVSGMGSRWVRGCHHGCGRGRGGQGGGDGLGMRRIRHRRRGSQCLGASGFKRTENTFRRSQQRKWCLNNRLRERNDPTNSYINSYTAVAMV